MALSSTIVEQLKRIGATLPQSEAGSAVEILIRHVVWPDVAFMGSTERMRKYLADQGVGGVATWSDDKLRDELSLHATLFGHQNRSAKDSPLLSRLADYHCDCTFFARELQHLIFEIDTLVKDCPLAAAQRHILKQLRDTCELALKQGHSVYVLCD